MVGADEYRCDRCADVQKRELGCDQLPGAERGISQYDQELPWRGPDGLPARRLWDRCPVVEATAEIRGWLHQACHYRAGRLFYPGSVGEQPARAYAAWSAACSQLAELEADREKRAAEERERLARQGFDGGRW